MKSILEMEAEEEDIGNPNSYGDEMPTITNKHCEKLVYNDITSSTKTTKNLASNTSVMTDDFDRTVSEISMIMPLTFGNNMLFGKNKKQEGDRYMLKDLD